MAFKSPEEELEECIEIVLKWDWEEIDAYLYQDNALAGKCVYDRYEDLYGKDLRIQTYRWIVLERSDFLRRYYPDRFVKKRNTISLEDSVQLIIRNIDSTENKVIRLYLSWNTYDDFSVDDSITENEPGCGVYLEDSFNILLGVAECVRRGVVPEGGRSTFYKAITHLYQEIPTIFDPEFPKTSPEQMQQEVERTLQAVALKLGIPYSLSSESSLPDSH